MQLEKLAEIECMYRELYYKLPDEWEKPVEDWEELIRRYRRAGIAGLPKEAPSFMDTVLTEEDFFEKKYQEKVVSQ